MEVGAWEVAHLCLEAERCACVAGRREEGVSDCYPVGIVLLGLLDLTRVAVSCEEDLWDSEAL